MSRANEAVECYSQGFSCAQAVFATYCSQLGLEREAGLKLSCGLGGGMGRLGGTCGAISGAVLLIGLKYGMADNAAPEAKNRTYEVTRTFFERFKERNTYAECRELLGFELMKTDAETSKARCRAVCPKAVRDAAEIIEEMLGLE